MFTQFQGESRRDAIINFYGLDIEEEDSFFEFVEEMGFSEDSDDATISGLHKLWQHTFE